MELATNRRSFATRLPHSAGVLLLLSLILSACHMDPASRIERKVSRILEDLPDSVVVAVAVHDLPSGVRYEREADRVFHAASVMKIPVLIELYRRAERGDFSLDDTLFVHTRFRSIADSSVYLLDHRTDSEQELYTLHGQPMPIRELTRRMVDVSSNLATNMLIELVSADSVQETIQRLGTTTMKVLRGVEDLAAFRKGLNNTITARDVATLLSAVATGKAVSPTADAQMVEVLLGQEFNEMIPAGLPEGARVAHKTGQIAGVHHDAAIVYPVDGEPYVVVILTEGLLDDTESARIGAEISRVVYDVLRG